MLSFYPILLWLKHSIRNKSFNFFIYSNPAIYQGGMFNERKTDIYKLLPKNLIPKMILATKKDGIENIIKRMSENGISFPVFLKPNIGFRGFLVQKVDSELQLQNLLQKFKKKEFLIQEFIDLKNEYAILYYRFPNNQMTGISSFSSREYPYVVGDGTSTLIDLILIQNNKRLDLTYLNNTIDKNYIPKVKEKIIIDYVGNYARGSRIINETSNVDAELISCFYDVIGPINGLNFVRVDLKANSIEDIKNKNFKIIEVNGAKSESLHVYDETINLKNKLQIVRNHWKLLSDVSIAHRKSSKRHSFFSSIRSVCKLFVQCRFEK